MLSFYSRDLNVSLAMQTCKYWKLVLSCPTGVSNKSKGTQRNGGEYRLVVKQQDEKNILDLIFCF